MTSRRSDHCMCQKETSGLSSNPTCKSYCIVSTYIGSNAIQKSLSNGGMKIQKNFHARATERFRFNVIAQILAEDGRLVSEHAEKTVLF